MTKRIKIFIASSSELKEEREKLAVVANELNNRMEREGVTVQTVGWESVDSDSTEGRKQDEYIERLRDCDSCLVMFWRKKGKYTSEELDEAHKERKLQRRLKKVYVLFKFNEERDLDEYPEMKDFYNDRFVSHEDFRDHFNDLNSLKVKFLEYFLEAIKPYVGNREIVTIEDGKAKIDGKVYVELSTLNCFSKNEDYHLLEKQIKRIEKLLAKTDKDDADYLEYSQELNELLEKKQAMEKNIWNTSLELARMANEKCSDRLRRAINMLENGDNRGADALLNEEILSSDANANIEKIRVGKQGLEGLKINIKEYKAKISAIINIMDEGWVDKVVKLYDEVIKFARGNIENKDFADLLLDFVAFLIDEHQYSKAEQFANEFKDVSLELANDNPELYQSYLATSYNNLALIYYDLHEYGKSEECHLQALEIRKELAAANPPAFNPDLAISYNNLANLYRVLHEYGKSEKCHLQALEIRKELAAANPPAFNPDLAMSYNNLAVLYSDLHEYGKSEECHLQALEIFKELAAANPPAFNPDLAMSYNNLADLYSDLREYGKSEECHLQALAIYKELAAANPPAYNLNLAITKGVLSYVTIFRFKFSEAEKSVYEALAIDSTQEWIKVNLVTSILFQGRYEEAEKIALEIKDITWDDKPLKDSILDDFKTFEDQGIIPDQFMADVEKLRAVLNQ